MSNITYFAYGSNMLHSRLRNRTPSAQPICIAHLPNHKLTFSKASKDGSGKCHIEETGDPSDLVYGVVFEIAEKDKAALNRAEGLGFGYAEKEVKVFSETGQAISACTYFGTELDPNLVPYHWYKAYVVAGASENSLPNQYQNALKSVVSVEDPDPTRRSKNTFSENDS